MITLGLASNYSGGRAFRHLFAFGGEEDSRSLRRALASKYNVDFGYVQLYHSGRSALALALASLGDAGLPVIVPGLTCIAVIRAIKAAGMTPVYSDISREDLQYDYLRLEETLKKTTSVTKDMSSLKSAEAPGVENASIDKNDKVCYNGIILVQNTLGITLDIARIEELAKKYNFAIVEDLAHSAGRFYPDGREVGTVGAAAALSFGKGKAIDTINGGAAILRAPRADFSIAEPNLPPALSDRLRDRWYPIFGGLVRALWGIGLGQPLLSGLVRLRWIEKSADTALDLRVRLTHWQARLALEQLSNLPRTPLREFKLVRDRENLLKELEKIGYHFSDIWYDVPVAPERYASEADFTEVTCPETMEIASEIINLPTWYSPELLGHARILIKKYDLNETSEESDHA